ncbi:MAG: hypothetical protein ACOCRX_00170 [Candidatus Woesearchaeota archaeon]
MKKSFLFWISILFIISFSSSIFSQVEIDSFFVTSDLDALEISDSGNYYGLLHNEGSLFFRSNITLTENYIGWDLTGDNLKIDQNDLLNSRTDFDSCDKYENCTQDSCSEKYEKFICSKSIPFSEINFEEIKDFNEFKLQVYSNNGNSHNLPSAVSFLCHNAFNTPIEVDFNFNNNEDSIGVNFDVGEISPDYSCPMPSIERVNGIINNGQYNESVNDVEKEIEFDNVELEEGEHEIYLELYFNSGFKQKTSSQNFEFDNDNPEIINITLKDEYDNVIDERFVYDEENNRFTETYVEFIISDLNFDKIKIDLNELTNQDSFYELNLYKNGNECENIGGYNYSCRTDKTGLGYFKLINDDFKVYYSVCDEQGLCDDGFKSYNLKIDNMGADLSSWSSLIDINYDFEFDEDQYEKLSNSLLKFVDSNFFYSSNLITSNCKNKECFFRDSSSINYTLIFNDDNFKKSETYFDLSNINKEEKYAPDYFFQNAESSKTTLGVELNLNSNLNDFSLPFKGEDSLGNKFNAFDDENRVNYIKDNNKPIFNNISVTRLKSGKSPRESIATSDKVIVNISANDSTSTGLGFIVDFKDLTFRKEIRTGQCENVSSNEFSCIIKSDSPVNGGPITEEIDVYVFDLAGNTIKESYDVKVLGTMDEEVPDVTLIPDNFVPDFIDRQLVTLFNYPIRGEILLDSDRELFIDSQHFRGCNINNIGYSINDYGVFSSPGDMESFFSLDLPIMNKDDLKNIEKLDFSCSIDTYVRTKDYIYTAPDQQEMNFSIDTLNTPFNLPSQEIYDEVKSNIDSSSDKYGSFLHTARNVLKVGENACMLIQGLSQADKGIAIGGSAVKGVELVVDGISLAFPPLKSISKMLSKVTDILDNVHSTVTDLFDNFLFDFDLSNKDGEIGVIGKMCNYITCQQCNEIDSTMFVNDFYSGMPGIDDHHVLGTDVSGMVNPKDSLVLSIGCGCLGSIVFKLSDYRQMQCERDLCLLRRSSIGESTLPCRQNFVENQCRFITGEAYVLFPWGMGIDSWANQITNFLSLDENFIENAVGGLLCPEDGGKGEGTISKLNSQFGLDIDIGFIGSANELRDWMCRIPKGIFKIKKGFDMISEGDWLGLGDDFDWKEFIGMEEDSCEELEKVFNELDN